jgi:hypothetical protein
VTQPVYDLLFGTDPNALHGHPRGLDWSEAKKLARPDAIRAGWAGGTGPGIARDAWPRSPTTGYPMTHLLTLELPEAYRRKGGELCGIALFQADDHVATATPGADAALERGEATSSEAFFVDLVKAHASRHPEAIALQDIIGGNFVLLWLRADELAGRTDPPADTRASATLPDPDQNLNAWDHASAEVPIWLAQRAFDPNAGKSPVEVYGEDDGAQEYVPSDAYVDVVNSSVPELKAFFEEVHGRSHLGGTALPIQAMPEGLTPFFLELEDGIGGANFGGGNLQLDLERGVLDWACG